MFATLKNKIKEETGSDISATNIGASTHPNRRLRNTFPSTISINRNYDEQCSGDELRSQCNDLSTKVSELQTSLQRLEEEKSRIDKTNEILLESVKVAQTQKDLYCNEQEKIQQLQLCEINKLKSLLSFREQEAVDRLAAVRLNQQEIDNLTNELERLKPLESMFEDVQDELERLRHSAQQSKNSLATALAAVEEENRFIKMRLKVAEEARLETITTLNSEEKIQALVLERKLLDQLLEEVHLQLSDVKSSWCGQNLALETQVSRLSKQVAEETTEKRKAFKERDDAKEKVKQLEFELLKLKEEAIQNDIKLKLLEEESNELKSTLREYREENEQQVLFERNKVEALEIATKDFQSRLEAAEKRFCDYAENAEQIACTLRIQSAQQQEQLREMQGQIAVEQDEKCTALLRNAEISQREELLKRDLQIERNESDELHKNFAQLEAELKKTQHELNEKQKVIYGLNETLMENEQKVKDAAELQQHLNEKNKTIKTLNQRLADLKKTLQKDFPSTKPFLTVDQKSEELLAVAFDNNEHLTSTSLIMQASSNDNNSSTRKSNVNIVMDEINFKYLKHVIVKFLTSREVEARHLIRAVSTLLKLTEEEEKLLHDTLTWKMSWFGSKPDHGSGQRAFSIPPI